MKHLQQLGLTDKFLFASNLYDDKDVFGQKPQIEGWFAHHSDLDVFVHVLFLPPAKDDTPHMAQVGDKYLTVKQAMLKYHLSRWMVYENIRCNPNFPVVNLGPKKNYRIPEGELRYWLMKRPGHPESRNGIPTGADLLQELGL